MFIKCNSVNLATHDTFQYIEGSRKILNIIAGLFWLEI